MARPGTTIAHVLKEAPTSTIRSFFSEPLLRLLELVDRDLLEGEKLRTLVSKLVDPVTLLRDPGTRLILVKLLPFEKQEELAGRCGLPQTSRGKELSEAVGSEPQFSNLLAFFGVDEEARITDGYSPPSRSVNPVYSLFEHQRSLAERAWAKLTTAPRTVVLHLPTGAGKTRTAMHIVAKQLIAQEPSVVVWLAHSAELLEQAASEMERAWASLGNRPVQLLRFWGSYDTNIQSVNDGIIVAGVQKLFAQKKRDLNAFLRLADKASLTIIDEAHIAAAPTYREIVSGLYEKRKNNRLLGLTATPGRTWSDIEEDKRLSRIFHDQKVMLEVPGFANPVSYLIEKGFLARPHFRLLNAEPGLRLTDADREQIAKNYEITDEALERLGEDPARNFKILAAVEDLFARHRRIIVFAPSVASAQTLAAVLLARGKNASYVTGEMATSERRRAIETFKSNRPEPIALCNFGVLTTGFDAPKTSAAIIARPTLSLVLYSQMVGRATRGPAAGGNETAEIVTVVDPELPGFGRIEDAFRNWEDVWDGPAS